MVKVRVEEVGADEVGADEVGADAADVNDDALKRPQSRTVAMPVRILCCEPRWVFWISIVVQPDEPISQGPALVSPSSPTVFLVRHPRGSRRAGFPVQLPCYANGP